MLRIDRRVLRNDGSVFLFSIYRFVLSCVVCVQMVMSIRIHWVMDVMFWDVRNEAFCLVVCGANVEFC